MTAHAAARFDRLPARSARATTRPRRLRKVVCLPGFGDPIVGERWVASLADKLFGLVAVEVIEWPGLWSRGFEPVSFTRFADEVAAAATSDTLLVGHSLGGRTALQIACSQPVAAVMAVCSPFELRLNAGEAAELWERRGSRTTARVAPNKMPVTFELPVSFLRELNVWIAAPQIPTCPTTLLFGGADELATPGPWADVTASAAVAPEVTVLEGCGHRFMDEVRSCRQVVDAAVQFVRRVHGPDGVFAAAGR